jgi:PKD repeat protein
MIKTVFTRALIFSAILLPLLSEPLRAQDVELNPGSISGTIDLGGEPIRQVSLSAFSSPFSSSQTISPGNATSTPYDLTVQVEAGASRTYNVTASIWTSNFQDFASLRNRTVEVVDGAPATLDFVFNPAARVEGTVTVIGGGAASRILVRANQTTAPGDFYQTSESVGGTGSTAISYSFPVIPGQSLRCSGSVNFTNGESLSLPTQNVTAPASGAVRCDYTVEAPVPPAVGSLDGIINLAGSQDVDRYQVWASGPTFRISNFNRPFDGPGSNETGYRIDNLDIGTYSFSTITRAFLNASDDELRFPESAYDPSPSGHAVTAAGVTTVDISACQAFLNGTLEYTGTASLSDLSFGQVTATGNHITGSPSRSGHAFDRLATSGAFDLVVTGDDVSGADWRISRFQTNLRRSTSNPDGFLNESIFLDVNQAAPLDFANLICGASAVRDFSIPTGGVTINFTVAGGDVLSNPRLDGFCQARDEITNELLYSYSYNSFSSGQVNVVNGDITAEIPAAICSITARATVNNTLVTFAQISNFEILPGVDVVIDIGAPTFVVTFPEGGLCIDADEITVTGIATDDIDVASITVNGVLATLTPTGNASDPAEVGFEALIPLPQKGPNEITIVAVDSAANSNTTTFTVFNDAGPPLVDFTPAGGATSSALTADISGTADDDAGIDSVVVSVNGAQVAVIDGLGALLVPIELPGVVLAPGPNTISIVATDISEKTTQVVHSIEVIENAPPIAQSFDLTTDEDVAALFNLLGSDPDGDAVTYSVLSNPSNGMLTGTAPNLTFTPDSNYSGPDSLTYQVNDGEFDSGVGTVSITVSPVNDPPVADAGGPYVVNEGGSIALDASGSTDPEDDTLAYVWDFDGDGEFDDAVGVSPNFDGIDDSVLTVAVRATDPSDAAHDATASVTVNNLAPVVEAGADRAISEGDSMTLAAGFTDAGTLDTHTVLVDWGDGTATAASLTASHQYLDDGVYTVTVTVTDDDGGVGSDTLAVTVSNVAPVVVAGADKLINEGDNITLAASFTDAGTVDTHTVLVDWGDGSAMATSLTASHQYVDDGVYTVTVTVTDDDGGVGSDILNVTAADVPPVITSFTSAVDPVAIGTEVSATGTFDCVDVDTCGATIDWGDGTVAAVTADNWTAIGVHSYATPGVYTLQLTVTDDDGSSDTEHYQFVVVYDPNGSFVTGGGRINAASGSYPADSTVSGPASFGLVAKYQKGNSTPQGNTQFQFQIAGLNFHSTSYDWLVIAGAQAKYKGVGTINGAGNYGFQLFATDGDLLGGGIDKFRIKIWDKSNGDAVVFDNEIGAADDADPTTAISDGQIVIHEKGGKKGGA